MRFWTRRSLLASFAASGFSVERGKGASFGAPNCQRFADPATELEVLRLTNPAYSSHMPAYYGRALSHKGQFLLCWSDRTGSPQAFRINLKSGEWLQLTGAEALDGSSLTLMPDERSFCHFDGPALKRVDFSRLREREIYRVPDGWQRCPGMSVKRIQDYYGMFAERQGDTSRLRLVGMAKGTAATVTEAPFAISDPVGRPRRTQVLYRQPSGALWLVNFDRTTEPQAEGGIRRSRPGALGSRWTDDSLFTLSRREGSAQHHPGAHTRRKSGPGRSQNQPVRALRRQP